MWPCNSIIIAFVWFVTHGKWTQNFRCGCRRILFKVSYPCRFHWMESQREWVSSSQCQGAVMDLGTVVVSLESSRLPGTGLLEHPSSSRAKEVFASKEELQHHPPVLTLRLLCFPVSLFSPSVNMIDRPWEQQLPGMCLHSPGEEKWLHLEHGPAFPVLFNSLPAKFSMGLWGASLLALLLTTPAPAAVWQEL